MLPLTNDPIHHCVCTYQRTALKTVWRSRRTHAAPCPACAPAPVAAQEKGWPRRSARCVCLFSHTMLASLLKQHERTYRQVRSAVHAPCGQHAWTLGMFMRARMRCTDCGCMHTTCNHLAHGACFRVDALHPRRPHAQLPSGCQCVSCVLCSSGCKHTCCRHCLLCAHVTGCAQRSLHRHASAHTPTHAQRGAWASPASGRAPRGRLHRLQLTTFSPCKARAFPLVETEAPFRVDRTETSSVCTIRRSSATLLLGAQWCRQSTDPAVGVVRSCTCGAGKAGRRAVLFVL
jgi:hypothetical protein